MHIHTYIHACMLRRHGAQIGWSRATRGTRHSSMAARDVGGTTDRNSLSTRQANGAAMLVEVDAFFLAAAAFVVCVGVCGRFITNRSARASKDHHCIFGLQTCPIPDPVVPRAHTHLSPT